MFLDTNIFSNIVENTPLISMGLVVKNKQGQVLLGRRVHKPARNSWFVPGGRVFKDEKLDDAFSRIVFDELGIEMLRADAKFYGLNENFYNDNVFNDDFSTHYIVLAHEIKLDNTPKLNN